VNPAAAQALAILRDPTQFRWTVIPLLGFVAYVYAVEVEKRNWSAVFAGLAYWLMDWLGEVLNALILHFTGRAPLWIVSGGTSFLVLVGVGVEISFLFAVAGIVYTKLIPADPRAKVLGVPNRAFYIVAFSLFSAFVEWLLVQTPHFHWGYPWWNFPLVALFAYAPADWVCFRVFDSSRRTQARWVLSLATIDLALILVFGVVLGWI
jgi:hypothetical protein